MSKNKDRFRLIAAIGKWVVIGIAEVVLPLLLYYQMYEPGDLAIPIGFILPLLIATVLLHIINATCFFEQGDRRHPKVFSSIWIIGMVLAIAAIIWNFLFFALCTIIPETLIPFELLLFLIIELYANPLLQVSRSAAPYSLRMAIGGIARVAPILFFIFFWEFIILSHLLRPPFIPSFDFTSADLFSLQHIKYMIKALCINLSYVLSWMVAATCCLFNEVRPYVGVPGRDWKWCASLMTTAPICIIMINIAVLAFFSMINGPLLEDMDIPTEYKARSFIIQIAFVIVPCIFLLFKGVRSSFTGPLISPAKILSVFAMLGPSR